MYLKFAVATIAVLAFGFCSASFGTRVVNAGGPVGSSDSVLPSNLAEGFNGIPAGSNSIRLRTASNGSLRRALDAATGASPAMTAARNAGSAATSADLDEIFWDGYERCGNGVIDDVSEQCDRSDLGGTTCISLSYGGGTLACDKTCHFDTSQCTGTCLLSCNSDNDCGVCGICFENLCLP